MCWRACVRVISALVKRHESVKLRAHTKRRHARRLRLQVVKEAKILRRLCAYGRVDTDNGHSVYNKGKRRGTEESNEGAGQI